jgi:hypothetical protein
MKVNLFDALDIRSDAAVRKLIVRHPFEDAGLGKAPYRFIDCVEYPDLRTCDCCGNKRIKYVSTIKSADGTLYKVGSTCVKKTGDNRMIERLKVWESAFRREAREAKEALRE